MRKFNIDELDKLVDEGKLIKQVHPKFPLRIYKYSVQTVYSHDWNDITIQCRGLVVDDDGYVYSNPIPKFHNIEELKPEEIPNLPYEITDKLDGTCIEVFLYKENLIVCSLGSFASVQAIKAENLLLTKYSHLIPNFKPGFTYIFELIF